MSFGRVVRKKREALGLTLEEFAERSGLSPNYVGTIENERRDPSLSTVLKLAKALRVPAGDLLGGIHDLRAEGVEAGRLFESAPADVQDAVLRLLRAVARRRR
ncbi:MAG TPA: helix-turn-helix transcriptional regulator [Polyangiaceae bacterium]